MILFLIIIVPLLIYSIWIFFKKVPPNGNKSHIAIYNIVIFLSIFFLSIYLGYRSYNNMINTIDFGWAPVTAFISATLSFLVCIFFAFLIRNFLIFRKK